MNFRNTIKSVANLSPVKLQSSNKEKQHTPYFAAKPQTKAKRTTEQELDPVAERRSGQDRRHQQGSRGPWLESRQGDRRRNSGFNIKA